MRLIDADKLKGVISDTWILDRIDEQPTVDVERTEEQVKEYCRKRCLVIVNIELFNEMTARWSGETVKHGHWINKGFEPTRCSVCGITVDAINGIPWAIKSFKYCPYCGAKMDEVAE